MTISANSNDQSSTVAILIWIYHTIHFSEEIIVFGPNWIEGDGRNSYDDYVLKAVNFCSDINKLSKIRKNLRKQISESSLFNISLFISNFEKMLWDMWKNFKK